MCAMDPTQIISKMYKHMCLLVASMPLASRPAHNAWLLTVLLTLASHLHLSLGNHEHTCRSGFNRPHPRGVCGVSLALVIDNLCAAMQRGGFLARVVHKREARDTSNHVNEKMRGIMLNKKEAFSYLSKREATGSMTCECCYNQCRLFELAQYCQHAPRLFTRRSRRGRTKGRSQSRSHQGRHINSNHNVEDSEDSFS